MLKMKLTTSWKRIGVTNIFTSHRACKIYALPIGYYIFCVVVAKFYAHIFLVIKICPNSKIKLRYSYIYYIAPRTSYIIKIGAIVCFYIMYGKIIRTMYGVVCTGRPVIF